MEGATDLVTGYIGCQARRALDGGALSLYQASQDAMPGRSHYRVTLSITHLGSVNYFPKSFYFIILLPWAGWQL